MPFSLAQLRILQSGGPPLPILQLQLNVASFCRNCQNIGKSRQTLLHGGFVLAGRLVLVCDFVVRRVCSISYNRLRGGVFFGLAWLNR
ncbi:MAG: hypothetical protein QXQ94_00900 [Candidatus Bathyarchaeia archaeon]